MDIHVWTLLFSDSRPCKAPNADAAAVWSEEERAEFASYIAANPEAGDLVPGSGGCRKIRWGRKGTGKRGGVRVIYTARLRNGAVVLLLLYAKSAEENIPSHILKQIAEE